MRRIYWKHRLKCLLAISLCLGFTLLIYFHLPFVAIPQLPSSRHFKALGTSRISRSATPLDLTVVIREFEDFENTVSETVVRIRKTLGAVNIVVVADNLPYPPIDVSLSRETQVLVLSSDLSKNYSSGCPLHFLNTNYILFIPDGVAVQSWKEINLASELLTSNKGVTVVAIAVVNKTLECSSLKASPKEWTVDFRQIETKKTDLCSYVDGVHAILMTKETLSSLSEPFARPFPFTLYIQAAVKNWNVFILRESSFVMFHEFFKDFHHRWKYKQAHTERLTRFYKQLGIKREILKSGISKYYGCTKSTARCFGTVIHDMPHYLYEGKWTPPCCLKGLRESAAHVFTVLEKCGARYWLEGGSLLGAARHGDIIPWDYDVDVGIYLQDVDKCEPLLQAKLSAYIDDEDYVWEKASEGEFYRVQFSEMNHLHVDIFPFYSKNGVMTKNTWFKTHRQDTEFPESYLTPLTRIKFAGTEASAPNSVREFLEYKFGQNVIESPRYPNLQMPVL